MIAFIYVVVSVKRGHNAQWQGYKSEFRTLSTFKHQFAISMLNILFFSQKSTDNYSAEGTCT